ncbi:DUF4868 domain-containing protein [Enterococcus pseudoavium]|uniref:DUF4868 domain-containing protein n=1 Tax=Enterococcus pseudoavium TaxID=44007 RepID=A0ABU3FFS9_9ENTE|nr:MULTISPECIES: Kiwa anti-phage protein KwaB-like domain-containing protein [Enterococcus]MDT2604816.1 DUF4868 domain-containing protein [Enterococcus dongliensis]MDT2769895.1 DUF4868 domain-containing protein [Enterococcus pseudoavium]
MDVNQLFKDVKKVSELSDKDFEGAVEFFLLTEKKKDGVQVYSPDVKNSVQRELLDFFIEYFKFSQVRNRTQVPYDVVMVRPEKKNFFICESSKYEGVETFYNQFYDKTPFSSTKGKNVKNFIAYALKIYISEDDYLCFIGPFTSLSQVKKTRFVGNLNDKELTKVNSEHMFGLSPNMAMLMHDNEVLFNNIPIFEKCCEMSTEFKKNASEVIDTIDKYNVITGIQDLKSTVQEDERIARRLTKMNQDPERVKSFFSNIKNVKKVLNDPSFKERFSGIEFESGKLEYKSEKRQQFVTLIADAAYESIVGRQKRIDHSL